MNSTEVASGSRANVEELEEDNQTPDNGSDDRGNNDSNDQDSNATKDLKGNLRVKNLSKFTSYISPNLICPMMTKLHFLATRLEIYAVLGALFYVVISLSWAESIHNSALQLAGLFITAQLFGIVAGFARLPPLLGMLLAGVLLRHLGFFHAEGLFLKFTATVRTIAMTMILIRAGLGLDASALLRLKMVVLRLSLVPCIAEAITVAIISHFLLHLPWNWGFLLGFVLSSVSPAVVVPSLIVLQSNGYGEDKGIGTLVIASSSLDNICSITLFGVVLSTIFSKGSLTEVIMQGPLEVLIGITWGFLMGIISIYIPHRDERSVIQLRTIMIGASGLLTVLGSQLIGYTGAGPLGCIVSAFVAACGWRAFSPTPSFAPVLVHMNDCWLILQPFLFALIGTEINLRTLNVDNVLLELCIIIVGVLVRMCICCFSVQGCGLNLRETLFVCLSWLPKATVQAVLGPVALDTARTTDDLLTTQYAGQVLTVAVLSIILTAPIGAVGIQHSGPMLLNRSKMEDSGGEVRQPNAELQTIT